MNWENVQWSLPNWQDFQFPPLRIPEALPPPPAHSSHSAPPFDIPPSWFTAALDPRVPITIATVYVVVIKSLNAYNASFPKKEAAWRISKTRIFTAFVILHNFLLAVYSAWTCLGMGRAWMRAVIPGIVDSGALGFVDRLCNFNGPAGLGDAYRYNESLQAWTTLSSASPHHNLQEIDGELQPGTLVPGRMWNEGLAFYGWFFYLSKFYEVVDTLIILAKGKQSSTLQTYHHAGAMMCMWAGIRYMTPGIWVFVLMNSFIHALMYTYYTFTALRIRVPVGIKQTLTTLQITQFLIGGSLAALHNCISYSVPVTKIVQSAVTTSSSKILEQASSVATEVVSVAADQVEDMAEITSAAGGVLTGAKRVMASLVANQIAGLAKPSSAQTVANLTGFSSSSSIVSPSSVTETVSFTLPSGEVFPGHHNDTLRASSSEGTVDLASSESWQTTEYVRQHCVSTSGQSFALWLNVIYLTPLTYLFVSFFINSYLRRPLAQVQAAATKTSS